MATSPNQNLPNGAKSVRESFLALIKEAQSSAEMGICVGCGKIADFQKVTLSLFETDESTQITLPVCQECASAKDRGRINHTTDGSELQ